MTIERRAGGTSMGTSQDAHVGFVSLFIVLCRFGDALVACVWNTLSHSAPLTPHASRTLAGP
eukprot:2955180-Prymnesium_polylepis.1